MDLAQGTVDLVMEGSTYDQASAAALRRAETLGMTPVPAFNHPLVAAGQSTAVLEAIEQMGFVPDVVILPVGGGGLLAGTAAWLRTHHPQVRIIGVEPEGAPCAAAAMAAGRPVTLRDIDTFIDGAAVSQVGQVPFEVLQEANVELVRVPEGQVCSEMLAMYQTDGIIAEPAGALAVTALHQLDIDEGATVVCIVSGGNNDVSRYSEIIERSLVHRGLKHYFLVKFPQEPGQLRRFLDEVLGPEDDITQFEYLKRNNREYGAALVGIELGSPTGLHSLLERMDASRIDCERLEPGTAAYEYLT